MGIALLSAIGFLVAVSVIGVSIYATRKNPIDEKYKLPIIIIVALQALHILLYFTGILAAIINANAYVGFIVCVIISFVCLLLSLWLVLQFSKFRNAIKYMFLLFAVIQVLTTIVIFLMPAMGGLHPLIQF